MQLPKILVLTLPAGMEKPSCNLTKVLQGAVRILYSEGICDSGDQPPTCTELINYVFPLAMQRNEGKLCMHPCTDQVG